jgi:hypothetical protein
VTRVELVSNGEPSAIAARPSDPGGLRFAFERDVGAPAWYALRVSGDKLGEAPLAPPDSGLFQAVVERATNFREVHDRREAFYESRARVRPSAAHSAPIYVSFAARSGSERLPGAGEVARASLARLNALEERLSNTEIDAGPIWHWLPYSDGVSAEPLRRNRPALLRAIAAARARYEEILAHGDSESVRPSAH